MNRKSKNSHSVTALYCRLSIEDGRDNESMSIQNQKVMLKDFAEKNGLLDHAFYVDDGFTGRNFNRPAFQQMIADIEAGKVKCVITKDLSRLGRNYIEAGSYIEVFFPRHNVRYIAITDGVDSLNRQEMDITPFKNILNAINEPKTVEFVKIDKKIRRRVVKRPVYREQRGQDQKGQKSAPRRASEQKEQSPPKNQRTLIQSRQ